MLMYWLWLATRPGLPDTAKLQLLLLLGDAENIYHGSKKDYRLNDLPKKGLESLLDKNLDGAKALLAECVNRDVKLLTFGDPRYPILLKNIPDPPVVLYYRGHLPDFNSGPCISIVGTRRASLYGTCIATQMGRQISSQGALVATGLAAGIDSAAAEGVLSAGQPVVGILGCGVDVVYPKFNRRLFTAVLERGCLLSEFPPGSPALGWHFPKRNRILSGISNGVLVVEAPKSSGALITAHLAFEQGRDVFVVPGSIASGTCSGSNGLLRDFALAVTSSWDVLDEYALIYPGKLHRSAGFRMEPEEPAALKVAQTPEFPKNNPSSPPKAAKKGVDKPAPRSYSGGSIPLSPKEQTVLAHLSETPVLLDALVQKTGVPSSELLAILTMLQVKELVGATLPGGRYIRK